MTSRKERSPGSSLLARSAPLCMYMYGLFFALPGFRVKKVIEIWPQQATMPTRCIVAGCSNTPKDGVRLHRFPKDPALRKIWAAKVRLTRANWDGPSPTSVICSDHFTADDYEKTLHEEFGIPARGPRLKDSAIPTRIRKDSDSVERSKRSSDAFEKRERKRVSYACGLFSSGSADMADAMRCNTYVYMYMYTSMYTSYKTVHVCMHVIAKECSASCDLYIAINKEICIDSLLWLSWLLKIYGTFLLFSKKLHHHAAYSMNKS